VRLPGPARARLPARDPNVLYLVGRKFGTEGRSDLTWAINTLAAAHVADRFRDSRIVVFSSGNLYGMVPPAGGGSRETDTPAPVGEYAQSCLGRERVVEYFSRERGTRCLFFRLNYAVDLRYGVLMDIGRRVFEGRPIDLRVACANVIWQGDASSYAFRSLGLGRFPAEDPERDGKRAGRGARAGGVFGGASAARRCSTGARAMVALLSNASPCHRRARAPRDRLPLLREWAAAWIETGGPSLDKPTHYEVADGRY